MSQPSLAPGVSEKSASIVSAIPNSTLIILGIVGLSRMGRVKPVESLATD